MGRPLFCQGWCLKSGYPCGFAGHFILDLRRPKFVLIWGKPGGMLVSLSSKHSNKTAEDGAEEVANLVAEAMESLILILRSDRCVSGGGKRGNSCLDQVRYECFIQDTWG